MLSEYENNLSVPIIQNRSMKHPTIKPKDSPESTCDHHQDSKKSCTNHQKHEENHNHAENATHTAINCIAGKKQWRNSANFVNNTNANRVIEQADV